MYVKDQNINNLIYYSKIVVGFFSNSLIEANIMGKDVLRLHIDLKDVSLDPILGKNIGNIIVRPGELDKYIKDF